MGNITKDPAYDAVDPQDFPAMLEVERYGGPMTPSHKYDAYVIFVDSGGFSLILLQIGKESAHGPDHKRQCL